MLSFYVDLVRKGHAPITLVDTLQCSQSVAAADGKNEGRTHRPFKQNLTEGLIRNFHVPHPLICKADTWSFVHFEGNIFPVHSPQHSHIPRKT